MMKRCPKLTSVHQPRKQYGQFIINCSVGKTPKKRLAHHKSHFNILGYLGVMEKVNASSIMNRKRMYVEI